MSDLAGAIRRDRGQTRSRRTAVVSAVDGDRVTVSMAEGQVVVDSYLEGYTPTVGDTVILLREESSWLLLGRVIGTGETAGTVATVQPRKSIGTNHATGFTGTLALANAAGEFPIASWQTQSTVFAFDPGRLYRIHIQTGIYNSGAVGGLSTIRLRKGLGGTTGQLLTYWRPVTPGATQVTSTEHTGYVKNETSKTILTDIGMSIERVIVLGNHGLYSDSNIPAILNIEDIGAVVGNPQLAAAAVSIV